jgi:cytochrome d ubiquinol oxidase subunit II
VLARDETERRVMINTIGPVWDGNETWFIVAGAGTFAAFPRWYATLFSGFYLPLLLILLTLIGRGVAFEYRHKRDNAAWRARWDAAIVIGSVVPSVVWGVAFANLVRGVAIDSHQIYVGSTFDLLNPFALVGGATTTLLFLTHGALFIALKTDGEIRHRARRLAIRLGLGAAVVAVVFMVWTQSITGNAGSLVLFAVAAIALLAGLWAAARGREGWGFAGNLVAIGLAIGALFVALFPDVMPSTISSAYSLTTTNASATHYSLQVMTVVAVIFAPLVCAYEAWTYWVFRRRISTHHIPGAAVGSDPLSQQT